MDTLMLRALRLKGVGRMANFFVISTADTYHVTWSERTAVED